MKFEGLSSAAAGSTSVPRDPVHQLLAFHGWSYVSLRYSASAVRHRSPTTPKSAIASSSHETGSREQAYASSTTPPSPSAPGFDRPNRSVPHLPHTPTDRLLQAPGRRWPGSCQKRASTAANSPGTADERIHFHRFAEFSTVDCSFKSPPVHELRENQ